MLSHTFIVVSGDTDNCIYYIYVILPDIRKHAPTYKYPEHTRAHTTHTTIFNYVGLYLQNNYDARINDFGGGDWSWSSYRHCDQMCAKKAGIVFATVSRPNNISKATTSCICTEIVGDISWAKQQTQTHTTGEWITIWHYNGGK